MKHKLLLLMLVITLIMSTSASSYADGILQDSVTTSSQTPELVIDEEALNLTNTQIVEYEDAADALAEGLKDASSSDYSEVIKEQTSNLQITNTISQITEDYVELTGETPSVSIDCDELVQTYTLDDNTSLEVTPLYIAIEEFSVTSESEGKTDNLVSNILSIFVAEANAATTTKSKGGISSKTFYAVGYGYKLLTVTVGMYFYYNGAKAWFKSDFDAYWKKYLGGLLFQVDDWTEKKEASGTSYQGWCSGVFGEGIVVGGNMISLMNDYIKVKVSCSKDGVITRTSVIK